MSTVPWLTIIGAVPLVGSLVVATLPRDPAPEVLAEREREYALAASGSPAIEAELEARMADYDERHGSAVGDLLDADEIDRDTRERDDRLVDRRPAQDLLAKQVTLGVSLITLVVAIAMSLQFKNNGGFQFVQTYDWVKDFGVHYSVGVDGIGLVLIDLTAILMPVVVLAAWG
jgi:NADH:ubiquinone oxidoreductase subunit 4 (subunit M)